jgi:hypothetical protein
MENPWHEFDYKKELQVHPADAAVVAKFNKKLEASKSSNAHKFSLSTEHTPLPYFGSLNSKLVILMANPGLDPQRTIEEETPRFREMFDLARKHELTQDPFVFLSEEMKETPGGQWWRKRLGKIIEIVDLEVVKQSLFTAEIHAYKSINYKPLEEPLATQSYTFATVQKLVDAGAYVILGRAKNEWRAAVKGLNGERVIELNSNQNSFLTEGNMPPGKFTQIVNALRQ